MSTVTMELSEHEQKVVLNIRREVEKGKREKQITLEILRTAYEFEKWLQKNRAGASYSTFCDEFGYECPIRDVERSGLYHSVNVVRATSANR